ncbi:MAG: membrane protein insertase YidC [Burkholderiaceae bacterium]
MDTRRTILWIVFSLSLFMLFENWQRANGHATMFGPATSTSPAATGSAPQGTSNDVPVASTTPGSVPAAGNAPPSANNTAATTAASEMPSATAPAKGEQVAITTDKFAVDFNTIGATIDRVELLAYRDSADTKQNFVLLNQVPDYYYVAQTGLVNSAAGAAALPTHRTPFTVVPGPRALEPGQDTLDVAFEAQAGGVKVVKTYTFHRGSYEIGVRDAVTNVGDTPVSPQLYLQLVRDDKSPVGGSRFYSTYYGPAVYSPTEKFQKVSFSDIEKGKGPDKHVAHADEGWVAMLQHYFVSAWIPANGARDYYTDKLDANLFRVGLRQPLGTIAPGATLDNDAKLYLGPTDERTLEKIAPGLDLVRDYGWTTILAKPMFWVLEKIHALLGNWGWSIILLTICIKLVFFPLSAASYKSMARMKNLAPRMKELQERHKEDRAKMNQATMELYRAEKINPMGGCLPIVIQIPFFIALYSTLLASVEMRGAPWLGWIHDLAAPDPFYILPVIMMASMFIQYKLNPAPPDPTQAKMMLIMPLVFGVTFFFFPAGLVLYWVVNNLLSIAQQWQITRMLGGNKPKLKAA